jgi:transcriptional regulator with XRE-family HTH domain
MTVSELAQEIGDSQQTVNLICNGTTKRTRLARVRAMAEVFELPCEWFIGTMKDLPGSKSWSGAHIHASPGDRDRPGAWQLAIAKWDTKIDEAYARDNRAGPQKRFEQYLRERLALTYLIHPGIWRDLLFESPDWRQLDESEDPLDEDTQVQLVSFMLDVLRPWIDGKSRLNYRNFLYIFGDVANHAIETLKTDPEWKHLFKKDAAFDVKKSPLDVKRTGPPT